MSRLSSEDRNRLSWWYPRIPGDINTPQTTIIKVDHENPFEIAKIVDGIQVPEFDEMVSKITEAGNKYGWPCFFRADHLSAKHQWADTCILRDPSVVPTNLARMIEACLMADFAGFPVDCFAVREMVPTQPGFLAFKDMWITIERRYFVRDGQVICHHPYWPVEAFEREKITSCDNWRERLAIMNQENDEVPLLKLLSSKVGEAIGGSWSVDWLWSPQQDKWYLIDMAEADKSYHWNGCKQAKVFDR